MAIHANARLPANCVKRPGPQHGGEVHGRQASRGGRSRLNEATPTTVSNSLPAGSLVVKQLPDEVPHSVMGAPTQAGCAVQPSFFEVETCPEEVGGGFRPPDGVRRGHTPASHRMHSLWMTMQQPSAVMLRPVRRRRRSAQAAGMVGTRCRLSSDTVANFGQWVVHRALCRWLYATTGSARGRRSRRR